MASFSAQRLWRILSESKVGKKGYYIVINSEGEILFHPDLETWLTEPHKIAEIGIKGFDPKADETKGIKFYTLSDNRAYLANSTLTYLSLSRLTIPPGQPRSLS